ncbi:DUF6042 family protein [Amycolatopsis sp. cg5]|uniref:DUF6042 family protein n=1 Tax=Amycolatopsis sp. cg5 TaxID=3238802 RepID=UPI003523A2AB
MAIRWIEDDEYLPDHGTVVVRDVWVPGEEPLPEHDNPLLGEYATDALSGTVATAGDGWLHGTAGDPYQRVRLEAHDHAPPLKLHGWEEVLESPYRCRSGLVGLGLLTGGTHDAALALGGRGMFRARVSRKPADDEGEIWLIQFWPDTGSEPPRWLARTREPIHRPRAGWQAVVGYQIMEMAWLLPLPDVPRPAGWLDGPIPAEDHRLHSLDDVCTQLGVATPATRREAIPLLLAAGLLTQDGGGYASVAAPPAAATVLDLPPEAVATLDDSAARDRYTRIAGDLTMTAAWSDPAPISELAERLLIPENEVLNVVTFAEGRLIARDGDTVTALPRRPPPPPPPMPFRRVERRVETVPGPPPRAGILASGGEVVVWRDGDPHVLGKVPGEHLHSAHETVSGVAVFSSSGPGTLVGWDGTVSTLPVDLGFHVRRSADGRYLAGVEWHIGRKPWEQLHLIDLGTGTVHSLPRDEERFTHITGIHNGIVHFGRSDAAVGGVSFRWTPGTEPEPLPAHLRQLDPMTGTAVIIDASGRLVAGPSGIPIPPTAELAPGGDRAYAVRHSPCELHLWALGESEPAEYPLPEGCATSLVTPNGPVWEDEHTLLLHAPHSVNGRDGIVRLRLDTGVVEHFAMPGIAGYRPIFIRPRLR